MSSSSTSAGTDSEIAEEEEPLLFNLEAVRAQSYPHTDLHSIAPTPAPTSVRAGHGVVAVGNTFCRSFLLPSLSLSVVLLFIVLGGSGLWTPASTADSGASHPPFAVFTDDTAANTSDSQLLTSLYDTVSVVAWKRPLRLQQSAVPAISVLHQQQQYQQQHTAICINFNKAPRPQVLTTILAVHVQLHRYLTIVSPVPWRNLRTPLPPTVHYIECAQDSVLERDDVPPQARHYIGYDGTLQHVCAASCFDYYAAPQFERLRGVVWQADDMFVNYTTLFHNYPHNKSWSPSLSHDSLLPLTNDNMYGVDWWTKHTPVANLFAARQAMRLLQSDTTYRQAWLLAFGSLDAISDKAWSDFFYLPRHQLRTYVDITNFLRYAPDQFVTVPDVNNRTRMSTVRVGLTMCEWWTASQVRLTAAIHTLQLAPDAIFVNCDMSQQLLHVGSALLYVWNDERNNYTRMHDYCFHTALSNLEDMPPVTVHPLKLSVAQHRQTYLDAYQRVRETL